MRLTTAQKCLMAAALVDGHDLTIGQAIDYVDTAAKALTVDDPDLVVAVATMGPPV